MSAPAATRSGQIAAERLMVDNCLIRRRDGEVTDPDTGVVGPSWTTVYTGKCKLQEAGGFAATGTRPEAGEHQNVVQRYVLHLPITVTDPAEGDVMTVTASANETALTGRTYRLAAEFAKTFATARRITVEETVA